MLTFDTVLGSFLVVMFVLGLITAFAVFVTLVMYRLWGNDPHQADALRVIRPAEAPPLKQAA
jgi:hypothetical protein